MTKNIQATDKNMASEMSEGIRNLSSAETRETAGGMLNLGAVFNMIDQMFELVGCGEDHIGKYCEYKVNLGK